MGFAIDTSPEEDLVHNTNRLTKPGWYHLQVVHTDENPLIRGGDNKGKAMDGFRIEFSVLAGKPDDNTECEVKKTNDYDFRNPNLASSDGGKWARNKQTAYCLATGLTTKSQLGEQVTVELEDSINHQVVAQFEKSDKGFLVLHYANIYHVDDPRAKDCPKDAKALALVPKAQRRDPASFKSGGKGEAAKPASGAANGSQSKTPIDDDLGEM